MSDDKIFMSQATFYLSGKANTQNCHGWARHNPRVSIGPKRDSLKFNVVCVLSE